MGICPGPGIALCPIPIISLEVYDTTTLLFFDKHVGNLKGHHGPLNSIHSWTGSSWIPSCISQQSSNWDLRNCVCGMAGHASLWICPKMYLVSMHVIIMLLLTAIVSYLRNRYFFDVVAVPVTLNLTEPLFIAALIYTSLYTSVILLWLTSVSNSAGILVFSFFMNKTGNSCFIGCFLQLNIIKYGTDCKTTAFSHWHIIVFHQPLGLGITRMSGYMFS